MEFREEKNRFALIVDGKEIGEMTWSDGGNEFFIIDHTYVDDTYRGHGYAAALVEQGVLRARRLGMKIIPLCPFAKKEFDTKPEYADVKR